MAFSFFLFTSLQINELVQWVFIFLVLLWTNVFLKIGFFNSCIYIFVDDQIVPSLASGRVFCLASETFWLGYHLVASSAFIVTHLYISFPRPGISCLS